MQTTITQIGNSQGIRIPKLLLSQLGLSLSQKVNLFVDKKEIRITPTHPRAHWEDEFQSLRASEDQDIQKVLEDFIHSDLESVKDWEW